MASFDIPIRYENTFLTFGTPRSQSVDVSFQTLRASCPPAVLYPESPSRFQRNGTMRSLASTKECPCETVEVDKMSMRELSGITSASVSTSACGTPTALSIRNPQSDAESPTSKARTIRFPQINEGSAGHADGTCNTCAFYFARQGCKNGLMCEFCHLCPPRAFQKKKKLNSKLRKENEQRNMAEAASETCKCEDIVVGHVTVKMSADMESYVCTVSDATTKYAATEDAE
eukprot:GEMP01033822.1.p1 GENE.GEMP01033822.1~~GEMP01033822.1.p1  ORF type:complete len:230 (+),score=46.98 GEMP01033822.1:124-813(+)